MRIRKVDPLTGDMLFGHSQADYWLNDARGVGQLVSSRLRLWLGDWFLNTDDGTPWLTRVLGKYTTDIRDATIQQRILATPNVTGITNYNSQLDPQPRAWTVHATIGTTFGQFMFRGSH